MDDSRGQQALESMVCAVGMPVAQALDDARDNIVNIVEDGLATLPAADLNQLDAIRWYINRALTLHESLVGCVESAMQRLAVVMAENVVELRPETPGGAA